MEDQNLPETNQEPESQTSQNLYYGNQVPSIIQREQYEVEPEPVIDPVDDQEQKEKWRRNMRETVETLILALLLFVVINTLSIRIQVDGFSMIPSFDDKDMVIVNRLAYKFGDIERGDVVVFALPQNPDEDYIKRVIAIGGDTINVEDGVVYINGFPADEPYIKEPPLRNLDERTIPEGSVFVMGDNRNDSNDSRTWGPLPVENIIGKAIFIYYPFSNFGLVSHAPEILE